MESACEGFESNGRERVGRAQSGEARGAVLAPTCTFKRWVNERTLWTDGSTLESP